MRHGEYCVVTHLAIGFAGDETQEIQAREAGQRQKSRIVIFANEFTVAKALVHVVGTKKSLAAYSRGKGASTLVCRGDVGVCGCVSVRSRQTRAGMASCHTMRHLMCFHSNVVQFAFALVQPKQAAPSRRPRTVCFAHSKGVTLHAADQGPLHAPVCVHIYVSGLGRTQASPLLGDSAGRWATHTGAGFRI